MLTLLFARYNEILVFPFRCYYGKIWIDKIERDDCPAGHQINYRVKSDFTKKVGYVHIRNQTMIFIDDYDRWVKYYPETDNYIRGCDICNTTLFDRATEDLSTFWKIECHAVSARIEAGKVIEQYLDSRYHRELAQTFEVEINGRKVLCKNACGNSFNFLDKIKEYPAVCLFYFNGRTGKWSHSIYSSDPTFDCAKVCEKYGGGGHKGAAGFSTNKVIMVPGVKINV